MSQARMEAESGGTALEPLTFAAKQVSAKVSANAVANRLSFLSSTGRGMSPAFASLRERI